MAVFERLVNVFEEDLRLDSEVVAEGHRNIRILRDIRIKEVYPLNCQNVYEL
ncbi:hypothetical protein M569_17034 [Genlisea aurea]|uniref:Uncharacterized protein n=1 Tax=Genlisea aurea TaxID=192259 RepID=S8D504_9LAMI|nr:hypothetical protein M569_17034 [Genlisea aurea]